jgi:arylsulfatase
VLPTVFQLAGEPLPSDRTLDGRNIGSLLAPKLGTKAVPAFHLLYPGANNQPLALREGPWKLVTGIQQQYRDDGGFKASLQKPLLFQLEQDLGERIDRGAEHPDIVDTMKKEFLDQVSQIRSEGTFWGADNAKGHDASDDEPAAPAKPAEGR